MKSWIWFRALAVILAVFTLGHTGGTRHAITTAPGEAAVIASMQQYQVPVMGFLRTYWDFYRGFSITISILLAALAVIAWQIGTLGRRNPAAAVPLAMTILIVCIADAIVSFIYFFTAPMVLSTAAVICAAIGVGLLTKEGRSAP